MVLAQVGNATLTLDELRESFPADYEQLIRREQYLDFIKRWMDDEAVYQQALKAKLETDPAVGRKLEKLRRKVMIEEFLSRENASEVFEPDEMAMNQYYEMHKEEFRRKVPEYKLAHIRMATYKQAMDLRSKANRGDFLAVAAASSLDPAPESYASIAFKRQNEFPPCLTQEIEKAGIGGVTLPVACTDGFYLVKVMEKQDAGSLIPFAEAKEEISGILIMERKDKLLDGRVAKYKEGLALSYNLDQIPGLAENGEGAAPQQSGPAAAAPAGQPSAPATAAPVAPVPVAASRLSTFPASAPAPAAAAASTAAAPTNDSTASDPRLPREPWQDRPAQAPAPAKPKYTTRKRYARPTAPSARTGADTADVKTAAPKPVEPTTETPAVKPETDENANAQTPPAP